MADTLTGAELWGVPSDALRVTGRFRKARVKPLKKYGTYRGAGTITAHPVEGLTIEGRRVKPAVTRVLLGLAIIAGTLVLSGGKFAVGFIPVYVFMEYVWLDRANARIPWSSVETYADSARSKLIAFRVAGWEPGRDTVVFRSDAYSSLVSVFDSAVGQNRVGMPAKGTASRPAPSVILTPVVQPENPAVQPSSRPTVQPSTLTSEPEKVRTRPDNTSSEEGVRPASGPSRGGSGDSFVFQSPERQHSRWILPAVIGGVAIASASLTALAMAPDDRDPALAVQSTNVSVSPEVVELSLSPPTPPPVVDLHVKGALMVPTTRPFSGADGFFGCQKRADDPAKQDVMSARLWFSSDEAGNNVIGATQTTGIPALELTKVDGKKSCVWVTSFEASLPVETVVFFVHYGYSSSYWGPYAKEEAKHMGLALTSGAGG